MLKFIGERKLQETLSFEKYGIFHEIDSWNALKINDFTEYFLSENQANVFIYFNDIDNVNSPRSFFTNFLLPSIVIDIAIEKTIPIIYCSITAKKVNQKAHLARQAFLNPRNSAETSSALLKQYVEQQSPQFYHTYFAHLICNVKRLEWLLASNNMENPFVELSAKIETINSDNFERKTLTHLLLENNLHFLSSEYGSLLLREKSYSDR